MCRNMIICLILIFGASMATADPPKRSRDKSKIWGDCASAKYAELNRRSGGLLTEYFQFLGAAGSLGAYMSDYPAPKRHQFFQKFLVQVFADEMKGDVGEAMFANVVMQFTPRDTVLKAIAPEIGRGGRLKGLLERPGSDVAKYLQRQSAQGYFGDPVFDEYAQFLGEAKNRLLAGESACEALISHMFATDAPRGLVAMLRADYGFIPYVNAAAYLHCKGTRKEVRRFQLIGHEISDCLYRKRYSFSARVGQEAECKLHLEQLSKHEKWWVRLYVAEIMRQHSEFRQPEIIERLKEDKHPLVRKTIAAFSETKSERGKSDR